MDSIPEAGLLKNRDHGYNGSSLSSTPLSQVRGWDAVEIAVRDVDEQTVKDYKEDIDTLLTFAGLFSAALTALLALSYSMLQPDPTDQMLQVMRQIANQTAGYTVTTLGGMVNTTAPPPSAPSPFAPTPTAIRVNALWFASLICSLSTASIGILVKQWLRAFLASKTSSTQGRLRLRHFRYRGILTWKVFEIAAALPLLIQLSLALFFVGLCFFTLDANPTIGRTTIAFVAAWALFFVVVTICPAFSAHCPYKTASIDPLLSSTRTRLYNSLYYVTSSLASRFGDESTLNQSISPKTSLAKLGRLFGVLRSWAQRRTSHCQDADRPRDESDAIRYERKDVDILASADELQSNDDFLGTAMLEALKQSQTDWEDIIAFLLRVLRTRLQLDDADFPTEPAPIDCRRLTRQAWTAITDILSQTCSVGIRNCLRRNDVSSDNARSVRWAICLLLSPTQHPLPAASYRLLGMSTLSESANTRTGIAELVHKLSTPENGAEQLRLLLHFVCHTCRESDAGLPEILGCLRDVLRVWFERAHLPKVFAHAPFPLSDTQRRDKPAEWKKVLNRWSLGETAVYVAGRLRHELDLLSEPDNVQVLWSRSLRQALVLSIRLTATERSMGLPGTIIDLVNDVFALQSVDALQTLIVALIHQRDRQFLAQMIGDTKLHWMGHKWKGQAIKHLQLVLQRLQAETPLELSFAHGLRLCYILTWLLGEHRPGLGEETWCQIFGNLDVLLQRIHGPYTVKADEETAEDRDMADWCLYFIHHVDKLATDKTYATWASRFRIEESLVSDRIVFFLMRICVGRWRYWRVQRLKDMDIEELQDALAAVHQPRRPEEAPRDAVEW